MSAARPDGVEAQTVRSPVRSQYASSSKSARRGEGVGSGWLIFKLPPAELGVHPAMGDGPVHELGLICDDVEATVAELTGKGVEFTGPVTDEGFGLVTRLRLPGGGELKLYQPKHATAYDR